MSSSSTTGTSSSVSGFLSTLIPVGIQAGAFFLVFLFLRNKMKRVYRPRTFLPCVPEPLRSKDLPEGRFNWLWSFKNLSDDLVLNHQSLDGFLYLRFLKMLTVICFVGCCITWPVLFPVNATGDGGQTQFDLLSFANIGKDEKNRYYAHVFVGWIFFSFVLFVITRETIFFINLRNAYLLSPFNAARISARTVLFTDVPADYLKLDKLQMLFGATIRRAWLTTDCKALDDDVENRDKAAFKLEGAEIKLSKKANKLRLKAEKKAAKEAKKGKQTSAPVKSQQAAAKNEKDAVESQHDAVESQPDAAESQPDGVKSQPDGVKSQPDGVKSQPDGVKSEQDASAAEPARTDADVEAGPVISEYLIKKDRPTHRLGKIPFIGKKVDTIDWCREELKTLIPKIETSQSTLRKGDGKLLPAVFIEFTNQRAAEAAYRRMTPRRAPHMYPRAISTTPDQIIWNNLKIKKYERIARKFGTNGFLTLMIIFWAIPVAVVGSISNINYLTDKVHFLSFINDIPKVILGVVTGLLPAILLSVLMSLVPVVCRWMSKLGGEVTLPAVELRTQHWYMAFQVVQVFLITTFASGASAVVTSIIKSPGSATSLLAENLPKASNFYISYIIVQGLGIASGNLLNIGALVMITFVGKFLDSSPRKMFKRYITLAGLGWGSLYPQFGNLGVIALSYSIISPLVMGFATVGFAVVYFAVRYNTFFVLTNSVDTQGIAYARAMQQLMTGVYISEVCLLGLFAINTAPGPIVLMAVFLGFTAVYHAVMRAALKPLTRYLPDGLDGTDSGAVFNFSDHQSYDAAKADGVPPSEVTPRARGKLATARGSLFTRLFNPQNFKSFQTTQAMIDNRAPPLYLLEEEELAYFNPSLTSQTPNLWIVRDVMGISRQECHDSGEVVTITDEFAHFNEKNKIIWDIETLEADPESVPVYQKSIDY